MNIHRPHIYSILWLTLVRDPYFDWEIVWTEVKNQDKDIGNHVFDIVLEY